MVWLEQNLKNGTCRVKKLDNQCKEDIEICFQLDNGKLTDGQIEYAVRILGDYKKYSETAFERLKSWISPGEYQDIRIYFGQYAYGDGMENGFTITCEKTDDIDEINTLYTVKFGKNGWVIGVEMWFC